MYTKLTLNVNKEIIDRAKRYAKSKKISLSRLIESYLASLTGEENEDSEITPLVESLSGVIQLPDDIEIDNDYKDFLNEKYK